MRSLIFLVASILIQTYSYAQNFKFIGKAKLEYSIFKIDIYNISYYQGQDGAEEMVLEYLRDIKKEHSIEGWKKGLEPILKKRPQLLDKLKWIIDQTSDLKQGDILKLTKFNGDVIWSKNGIEISRIKDQEISLMILYPWIGDQPINEDLKEKLLGK